MDNKRTSKFISMKYKKEILGLRKIVPLDIKTAANVLDRTEGDIQQAAELYKKEATTRMSKEYNVSYDVAREILDELNFDMEKSKEAILQQSSTLSERVLTNDKSDSREKVYNLVRQIILHNDPENSALSISKEEIDQLNATSRSILKVYFWLSFREDFAYAVDRSLTDDIMAEIERFECEIFTNPLKEAIVIKNKLENEAPRTKSFVVKLRLNPEFKKVGKLIYKQKGKLYDKMIDFALANLNELPK